MKRMGLTIIVVFLVFTALSYVIHGLLLQPLYQQTPQLLRIAEDAPGHFPFMLLAFLVFSVAFVWIYSRGLEAKPWLGQGLRYGLAVWLIASLSRYLIYFAVSSPGRARWWPSRSDWNSSCCCCWESLWPHSTASRHRRLLPPKPV